MERLDLKNRLREVYMADMPESVANRVFAIAWSEGHASGDSEVEYYYGDFAELAKAAFWAGASTALNEAAEAADVPDMYDADTVRDWLRGRAKTQTNKEELR